MSPKRREKKRKEKRDDVEGNKKANSYLIT
jgi:hypothetical protein